MPLMFRRIATRAFLLPAALAVTIAPLARAQNASDNGKEELPPKERLAAETYVKPPDAIARLVTAPRQNNVTLSNQSPNRKYFLKLQSEGLPSVQTFGKPHYYFAGLQVDYKANRARALTTRGSAGLAIIDATTGQSRTIDTPPVTPAGGVSSSTTSSSVGFSAGVG